MTKHLNENSLSEQPVLDWLKAEGYEHIFGPEINPEQALSERQSFREVVLRRRLSQAIKRFNPQLPQKIVEQVVEEFTRFDHPDLVHGNKEMYQALTEGFLTKWRDENGEEKAERVKLLDFSDIYSNEFLAVNQFTIDNGGKLSRPDVILFINGLPLVIFELKSPTNQQGTVETAYKQIERYKKDIRKLFLFNQIICISDLDKAKHGTISAPWERFGEWKAIEKDGDVEKGAIPLKTLVQGLCNKKRLLDIIQNFTVYEADSDHDNATYTKKMCLYHQYYGVCDTIESTIRAVEKKKRKIGVFWHTQGSGKSLSMVFYVNKTKRLLQLKSPAYLFLTDRNDLDNQLYKTFALTGYHTLAQQAGSIADLKEKLAGIGSELIFATIQKFTDDPESAEMLSERENIIVIADEAHRSQYSILAGNVRKALPNASFLGITGTPVSASDRDTQMVFGKVVSAYPINRAVEDGTTVPIYYEGRLVPLHLADKFIDKKFDELTSEIMLDERAMKRQEWATLEELIGSKDRLNKIAADIINHFSKRPIEGKGMIVTMSRRIALSMYEAIKARPDAPECALVVSGMNELLGQIQHEDVKTIERRFKNPNDSLQLVIVCDMWLTGFDVPALHTMYMDKPLKNHGLMQAIARVNRVYKDKPGGLIVDYIGIADDLKKALAVYSSDIRNQALIPLAEVIAKMNEKYDVVSSMFNGLQYKNWKSLGAGELAELVYACVEYVISADSVLSDENKDRFIRECTALSKLHALVMPQPEAMSILSDVQFFQGVKKFIVKRTIVSGPMLPDQVETAIRDLFHDAVKAEGVIDIFQMQGKDKPEVSIFDPKFIEEVKKMKFKNLAVDVVRKLLNDELRGRIKTNKVRYETLLDRLNQLIEQYENKIINSAKIIEQLLQLAEEMKGLDAENEALGLSEEELTFYDTLAKTSSFKAHDQETKDFVKEMVKRIRRDVSVDWTDNEVVKAKIRATIRLMLLQQGIGQDEVNKLVESMYYQAQVLYEDWVPVPIK